LAVYVLIVAATVVRAFTPFAGNAPLQHCLARFKEAASSPAAGGTFCGGGYRYLGI